ncbi:MAG: hypothetical protein ACOY0T_37285 [Myxococcota bacterium]
MNSNRHSDTDPSRTDRSELEAPLNAATPPRRTLPPPEWLGVEAPHSAASVALERYSLGEPVARRSGTRAELESLAARLAVARRVGDEALERTTAAALARALAAMGAELDQATKLARRSLLLGDDPLLRDELSGWFVTLGESALAAATLRPLLTNLSGAPAAELLVRIGNLLAHAGEAHAAREAYEQALSEAPQDARVPELAAALGAWEPDAVSHKDAADFYLEAALRRLKAGERAAAFENVLRAFEIAPGSTTPADRLAQLLRERGRSGAADEVRRFHAQHAPADARAVHTRRVREAVADGDLPRALGAAFDARLDAELDARHVLVALSESNQIPHALGFDDLLARLGLHDLLAARLELASEKLSGRERAAARLALARLYSGPIERPDRAVDAYLDAFVADPSNEQAHSALLRHGASTRDYQPLVEALIRIAESSAPDSDRARCLRELSELADERLQDANLMLWAEKGLAALNRAGALLSETIERLEPRVKLSDEALRQLEAELRGLEGADRIEPLSRVASLLLSRPGRADSVLPVLHELTELSPDERSFQIAIERVLLRRGQHAELESFYARLAPRAATASDRARINLLLANARRRRGDGAGALEALASVVDEAGSYPAALSMLVLLAAEQGNQPLHARALLRLATVLGAPLRAVLCAVAAEGLLAAGDVEAARRAADQAVAADPKLARPATARALVGAVTRDRWGAQAMERAMGVVVPRAELCAALAQAYDSIEEPALAFAFCLRRIALRPGDLAAARDRLERALVLQDMARLGDTLSWLLSQPQPLGELTELVARALRQLGPLDPSRAAALARRALDVLGPRATDIRLAAMAVADVVGERGLAISALERWLASGAPTSDRAELLLDLSRRRRAAGDSDGAARALMRAIRDGAWATSVLAELDVALPPRSSDGEIALLFARAEALSALSEADQRGTARAWRELGAAYWDFASDQRSALNAWERAVSLDLEHGIESFAADLNAFGGPEFALTKLEDLAGRREDDSEVARILALAANIALETNRLPRALSLALAALERDASRTDVLAVVERAVKDDDLALLDGLYSRLADAALGRYGERAVHYRAARQLEKRRAPDLALVHAIRAFDAVPSEGVVYVTMARLAERAGQAVEVVHAIERAAAKADRAEESAAWLHKAALLAGESEEGLRQRVEVLLRALLVRPDDDSLVSLAQSVKQLVALSPDEQPILELRWKRALGRLLPQLDGPEGARVAIAAACAAIEAFGDIEGALLALSRALTCDGEASEFERLLPHVQRLAPSAQALVKTLVEKAEQRTNNIGSELYEVGARLAEAQGETAVAARLFVEASVLRPHDAELGAVAARMARASGDARLIARTFASYPREDRLSELLEAAAAAAGSGDLDHAIESLEQARGLGNLTASARRDLADRLIALYGRAERRTALEELLEIELTDESSDPERRLRLCLAFARLLAENGDFERAIVVVERELRETPHQVELLSELVHLARNGREHEKLVGALAVLSEIRSGDERLGLLREIALLHESVSNHSAAARVWAEVSRLDPSDVTALGALEREAERSSDYDALVGLLARRAALASNNDELRRIRLRRASVLEQRLGRADEARSELESLLAATGDHLSVLRVLADLNTRLGSPLRAAPLWLRASAVTPDREEALDLSCRACEAYLAGEDVDSARRVLDGVGVWSQSERVLELAAEIERRRQDPLALADALDELANASHADSARRAAWLLEAAEASLAAASSELALTRALRAARLDPRSLPAQLLARSLEYKQRGKGSPDDAEITLSELALASDEPTAEQAELLAFLRAEALDVLDRRAEALAELERAEIAYGARPLISLGLGERLSRSGDLLAALPHFDAALGGDLRGLRRRGRVAWHAAECALALRELDLTEGYLQISAEDPETREQANARIREVFSERVSLPPPGPEGRDSPPPMLARRPSQPVPRASSRPSQPVPAERALASLGRYSGRPASEGVEERIAVPARISVEPAAAPGPSKAPGRYSVRPEAGSAASAEVNADSSSKLLRFDADEASLYRSLAEGAVEAGHELILKLEGRPDRTHDLVAVCRRLVLAQPADASALERLHRAALADKDFAYARAVEHVMGVLDPGAPYVEPPPLSEQSEQPDAVRALLLRDHSSCAFEALALVWEGAERIFRRDPSTYGVTGLERVPLNAPMPLARCYSEVARALGMLRTPLFQRRSAGPITVSLALLSPPAVVLSGDVRNETAELAYQLGATLLSASPSFALLLGSPESQARAVLKGLAFAFGPPQSGGIGPGAVPSLAEVLWESIPARLQRRLRELCDTPIGLDYDAAIRLARSATRRAGLFACGHLGVALAQTCAEEGIPESALSSADRVSALAAQNPSVRSLLVLATSPEYAQIRWWLGRGGR